VKQTHGPPGGEAYRAKTPPPGYLNRLLAAFLVGGGPAPISTSVMGQLINQERVSQNPFIGLPRFFFVIGRLCILNKVPYPTVLRNWIRDPVPFGSWIRNRFFPDPGSQPHTGIFDSFMTNFWVKSIIILSVWAKKNFFTFLKMKLFTIL
jgi:hypothetical protein